MWQGGDFPLEHVGENPMERGKLEEKIKKKKEKKIEKKRR